MTESDVYQLLKSNVAIKALINERVYPMVAPQNVVKPYLTYQVISKINLQCMGGKIYRGNYRMQIDCFSLTYSNVKAISKAVENALEGFMSSDDINIMDDYENETALFRQIIDFKLKD